MSDQPDLSALREVEDAVIASLKLRTFGIDYAVRIIAARVRAEEQAKVTALIETMRFVAGEALYGVEVESNGSTRERAVFARDHLRAAIAAIEGGTDA